MLQLLREGLGLNESQIEVGSGKEAWTLGAALSEGSKVLPETFNHYTIDHMPGESAVSVLVTVTAQTDCLLIAHCIAFALP